MECVFVSIKSLIPACARAAHVGVIVPVVVVRPLAAAAVMVKGATPVHVGASTAAVEMHDQEGVTMAAFVESVERDTIE